MRFIFFISLTLLMIFPALFSHNNIRISYVSGYLYTLKKLLSKKTDSTNSKNNSVSSISVSFKSSGHNYFKSRLSKLTYNNNNNNSNSNISLSDTNISHNTEENKEESTLSDKEFDKVSTSDSESSDSINVDSNENSSSNMEPAYLKHLDEIKKRMKENNIDVYILINTDEHSSEFINDKDKKIHYLSNFSGASGTLIITQTKQILYVNALYELQAKNEVDPNVFTIGVSRANNKDEVFETIARLEFSTLAFDGKCTSIYFYNNLKEKIIDTYPEKEVNEIVIYKNDLNKIQRNDNINVIILEKSLIELHNHEINTKKVFIHDRIYNGACAGQKIDAVRINFAYKNKNVNNLLLSELDEIAYLLNLRGYDFKYTPLFYSYFYMHYDRKKGEIDRMVLFTNTNNLSEDALRHLNSINVELKEYEDVIQFLKENVSTKQAEHVTSKSCNKSDKNFVYDISLSHTINLMIYILFDKEKVLLQNSPVVEYRAVKNDVEIDNLKTAHILDALALLQFFHWCNEKRKTKALFIETEMSLQKKVDDFRATKKNYISPSFHTISAIGSNAAIIHYESTEETDTKISPSIYLLDSGGQYLHGTTDVTRTTHFGHPTSAEKKAFTLVLKGHLHLRRVIFSDYTNSISLDFIARQYLYNECLEYMHSTGHGVGVFLNVHESGCSISFARGTYLKPFMVLSNEPGYYKEDEFGIRIENMQYVVEKQKTDHTTFLTFQDLTLYPYDINLMDFTLLTHQEI
uniref:Aminopeptidase P n=1 Tax=Piliocolobus tephrosceles TaxID=591936 RepID=A0A8C9GRS1_9PRIM